MRSKFNNILQIGISNFTTIFAGLVVGFILPKILSIEDYGYFRAFTLYVTYIGFFSLGIIDGIVLLHGGEDYKDIDKPKFRAYFIWYTIVHLSFTIAVLLCSLLLIKGEYKYIFILFSMNIIALNFAGYFQQISQITQRFREYSSRNIVRSILTIASVLIIYLLNKSAISINYKVYVMFILISNYTLTMWYIFTYRDIVFGPYYNLKKIFREIVTLIKMGFPLLFANLCSILILTIDRQLINILFGNTQFALYSFAYNILSLVTVATSAISIVLYPTLKRTTINTLKYYYSSLVTAMLCFLFGAISIYFPLVIFMKWYLPNYIESLTVFRVILPGLVISSTITVVMHNYYKVLNDNMKYFKKSIIILVLSIFINLIVYAMFKTVLAISFASIITMLIWYFYIESYFVVKYNYKPLKNTSYMLLMILIFYLTTGITNHYLGFAIYFILYVIITIVYYYHYIKPATHYLTKS